MDIRLHTDSKRVGHIGLILMAASLIPLLIMAVTGVVWWVWGTIGMFVVALVMFLAERSRNERRALLTGRHNAAVVADRYKLDITTAEGYRLVKGLKAEERDAYGEVVRRPNGSVRLFRSKDGEFQLRNVSGDAEYNKDAKAEEVRLSEAEEQAERDDYAAKLYSDKD